MKRLPSKLCRAAPLLAVLLLGGCAGNREPGNDGGPRYETESGAMDGQSSGGGTMGQGQHGQPGMTGPMHGDDMQAMCDRHRQMLDAKTPDERRALMNENMRNMPPEELERQMDTIRSQCG
jgi:hypothetical protein